MVARCAERRAKKPVLIIGHLDVVEAKREDWTTDPFQLVEKDGYFYGRGTQDMKVNDAILVTTFIRFQQEGYRPDRDLILALTADEEGGDSNGVDWLLKNHRDLVDAAFVLNADAGGVHRERQAGQCWSKRARNVCRFRTDRAQFGRPQFTAAPDNAIYRLSNALRRLEHSPFPLELTP